MFSPFRFVHSVGCRPSLHKLSIWLGGFVFGCFLLGGGAARAASFVSFVPVSTGAGTNAYGANDINSCTIDHDNLITVGSYQYIAYYGALSGSPQSSSILLGRRDLTIPNSAFTVFNSGLTIATTGSAGNAIGDDHNVVAMGVDSSGVMHLAYGMHNTALNGSTSGGGSVGYYTSNAAVNGSTWSSSAIQFTKKNSLVGANESEVTYPDFYNLPNSNTLLFTYRQGGAGGGSGNGDQYFDRYDPTTHSFTSTRVVDGMDANVNAYLNNLVYDSNGNLLMTWTWRASPAWQTNSNIMFAQSPDNGVHWFRQGGTTPYALPITPSSAQVVWNLSQNTSFINQTSMTVDAHNNPMVGTYWAPGGPGGVTNANAGVSASNNPNLQYMLVYYDGTQWRTSQVSHRTSDTAFDTSAADVRDLGRPIVLTDNTGHVLMLTRAEDTGMGSFANPATVGNDIVIYYNTVASLDSANPDPWQSITLDTANMGQWEPTYDASRWASSHILDMLYEPVGLSGESSSPVSVLEWNEASFFAPVPEPTSGMLLMAGGLMMLRRNARKAMA